MNESRKQAARNLRGQLMVISNWIALFPLIVPLALAGCSGEDGPLGSDPGQDAGLQQPDARPDGGTKDGAIDEAGVPDSTTDVGADGGDAGSVGEGRVLFDDAFREGATAMAVPLVPGDPPATVVVDAEASAFEGSASIRIDVPERDRFSGGVRFAQVVIELENPTDLSAFDAVQLAFRADSLVPSLNVIVSRQDQSRFIHTRNLGTTWQSSTLLFVNPAKADTVRQVTFAVEALAEPVSIYLDDIRFVQVEDVSPANYRFLVSMESLIAGEVEEDILRPEAGLPQIGTTPSTTVRFDPELFDTLISEDPTVATVSSNGTIEAVASGVTNIIGNIGGVDSAPFQVSVSDNGSTSNFGSSPTAPPVAPTFPSNEVLSIYSDSYTNVSAVARSVTVPRISQVVITPEIQIMGNSVLASTHGGLRNSEVAALFFDIATPVDTTNFSRLSFDFYADFQSARFVARLTDRGPGGNFRDSFYVFPAGSFVPNQWNHLEVPLSSFAGEVDLSAVRGIDINVENAVLNFPDFRMHVDNLLLR